MSQAWWEQPTATGVEATAQLRALATVRLVGLWGGRLAGGTVEVLFTNYIVSL